MNWKTWIPLVLAVGLALVAAKLTHDVIAGKKAKPEEAQQANFVQVVVARGDLPPGATLTKENLTLAPMPGSAAPAHTYTSTDDLIDRVSAQPLVQGQPINELLLAPKGSGQGLQALVPAGMRAVTIEVNEFTGCANLVAPGMNVDVLASFRDDTNKDTVSRTVVQNLKILAVGPRMTPTNDDPNAKESFKSVTLLATPKDAEKVELASYSGRPRLALRSGRDLLPSKTEGASLAEIVFGDPDSAANRDNYKKNLQAVVSKPATQPSADPEPVKVKPVLDPFAEDVKPKTRSATVIRNGVPSTVTLEVPQEPAKSKDMMIKMSTDEIESK